MRRSSGRSSALRAAGRAGGRAGRRFEARRVVLAAAAFALLAGAAMPGSAQNPPRVASEEGVKAAYLYKFPAYVDWPPNAFERPDSAVTIAVVDHERLADALVEVTSGRTVGGRPIRVRRLSADDSLADVHVVFLAPGDRQPRDSQSGDRQSGDRQPSDRQPDDPQPIAGQPILTVADSGAAQPGVVLTFVAVDGRVRFEVDLDEAQRRGLRLHSGLLAVAERVHGARR